MTRTPEVCAVCGAGDSCADCLGARNDRTGPDGLCVSCGGTGEEPPLLSSCSGERCGIELPGPEPG